MSLAGCAYGFGDEYSTTILEENKKLRAENERLKAELAEAKKDVDMFQWLQDNHIRAQAFFWNYQSRTQRRKAILEAMKGKK